MGTGSAVSTDEVITAAKMNLKLESVAASEIDAGVANSITFHVNAFQYPNPGTDWTPQLEGAYLGASLTAKKCWLPLNFLKVGDIITTYNLVGDVVEAATATLDCKLVRINKADPITTTDVTNGGITQVDADGNFDSTANCDDETVATDKQYVLEIQGTTGVGDSIIVMGAEVTITRILKSA
jgi:hypothetical protein